jgi:ferritin-like metal-binding protein YciE
VKEAIADFAVEHFEIGTYVAIMTIADDLGENEIVDICQTIVDEEQMTADWLESSLQNVVTLHYKHLKKE